MATNKTNADLMSSKAKKALVRAHKSNAKAAHSQIVAVNKSEIASNIVSSVAALKSAHPEALFSMKVFDRDRDLPIVYSDYYNIRLLGFDMMHPFDTKKYRKMADHLNETFLDTPFSRHRDAHENIDVDETNNSINCRRMRFLTPLRAINIKELELHHTRDYIAQIHEERGTVARILELWALNLLPLCTIEWRLLRPLKWQIAGTIYAAHLAMQHGWSINLGGGFHQASANCGESFCIFSDLLLAMKYVWRKHPLQKYMIIDLDAHQATGVERDLLELPIKRREMVFMVDIFNDSIQPPDPVADKAIDIRVELGRFTGDDTYLRRLNEALEIARSKFKPTLIFYVAGQDILKNDQLGLMNISDDGLKRRDQAVFRFATEHCKCPIVMLLGGGFLARGAKVQADSIRQLYGAGLIWGGHKSGERTLTRPVKSVIPDEKTPPTQTKAEAKSQKTTKSNATAGTFPAVAHILESGTKQLAAILNPVDAESRSVSTSEGTRKVHVIRKPPATSPVDPDKPSHPPQSNHHHHSHPHLHPSQPHATDKKSKKSRTSKRRHMHK